MTTRYGEPPPRKVWRQKVMGDLTLTPNARAVGIAADDADGWLGDWTALHAAHGLDDDDIAAALDELEQRGYVSQRHDGLIRREYRSIAGRRYTTTTTGTRRANRHPAA